MSYYGYHQRIRQRISAGELVDHYFPHRWEDYVDILAEWAKQRGGKDNAIHAGGAGRNGGG